MKKKIRLLVIAVAILLPPSAGMSQQTVQWEPSLDNAQRLASQTNRLVLVYFTGPACPYCRRMEAETLSQPAVAAAINADFVPVKIVADNFPSTAQRFGIAKLPTTVIVTPQGQIVDSKQGFLPADQYAGRIGQVAVETKRRREAVYAQMPSGVAPPATNQPIGNQPVTNQPPMNPPPMVQTPPPGQPPLGAPVATIAPPSNAPPMGAPPIYGQSQRPIAAPPTLVEQSPAPVPVVPNVAPQTPPPVVAQQPLSPPQSNLIPPAPAGNPVFGLDGFCPVSLNEKVQWVRGDTRWGATHRGRTYLFAGPEEQRRFFADPDRYAPVAAGNDVVLATEQGQPISGMREHGVFFGNRVYLFCSEASLEKFAKNPNAYANQALEAHRTGAYPPRQQWR